MRGLLRLLYRDLGGLKGLKGSERLGLLRLLRLDLRLWLADLGNLNDRGRGSRSGLDLRSRLARSDRKRLRLLDGLSRLSCLKRLVRPERRGGRLCRLRMRLRLNWLSDADRRKRDRSTRRSRLRLCRAPGARRRRHIKWGGCSWSCRLGGHDFRARTLGSRCACRPRNQRASRSRGLHLGRLRRWSGLSNRSSHTLGYLRHLG